MHSGRVTGKPEVSGLAGWPGPNFRIADKPGTNADNTDNSATITLE